MLQSTSQKTTKKHKMAVKTAQKRLKWPKNGQKGPKGPQNDFKNDTTTSPNDVKTMPKWSLSDPKWSRIDPKWSKITPKNHPKMVQKVPETTRKTAPKGVENGQKWSVNQVDMFNSVQEHLKSTYGTTRHRQFTYGSIFVNCRFKEDTSETSFRSLCKNGIFGNKNGM